MVQETKHNVQSNSTSTSSKSKRYPTPASSPFIHPYPANPTNHFFSRRFFLGFHLKFSSRRCVYTQNTYIIKWHLEISFSTPWILLPFFLLICPSCFGRLSIPEKEKPYNLSFKVIVVLLSCQGGYN